MTRVFLVLLLWGTSALAAPLGPAQVPDPLQPWIDWALHDTPDRLCPSAFDNTGARRCAWPGPLSLVLENTQGRFNQKWQLFAPGWVMLPGDARHWPQDVTVDGSPAAVVARNNGAAVWLEPGEHVVAGSFQWSALPETLPLAPDTALVDVRIGAETVPFPEVDERGQLWLRSPSGKGGEADGLGERLELDVFRRVIDEIPLQMVTRLDLRVAGPQREVLLPPMVPAGAVPLTLESALPVRLEADGSLRLQVRPGRWFVDLTLRFEGEQTKLVAASLPAPWPKSEIWVFDERRSLRLAEVTGVPSVDPRQTNLPAEWQHLPAYRVNAGDEFTLRVVRRGDPEPEPNRLTLQRTLWLDFDGGGYTVRDVIQGSMTQGWRLEADAPLKLGRVLLDDEPQFITRVPERAQDGVEVRRGAVQLVAESRLEGDAQQLPATGWGHTFTEVNATLNLPPGWRLLSASGVDSVPQTWFQRWTLLDLFLVLIIALAVGRLWGWSWAVLAVITVGLTWHEMGAPRYVWLHILAAVALLRVLPDGIFKRVTTFYRNLGFLALLVIALLYSMDAVRFGLYPQLERPWQTFDGAATTFPTAVDSQMAASPESLADYAERSLKSASGAAPELRESLGEQPSRLLNEVDPRAKLQTGPGLPTWQWHSVPLAWSGPVAPDQDMTLRFISPAANLALNLLRVALILFFAWRLTELPLPRWPSFPRRAALVLLALGSVLPAADVHAALPNQSMLDDLRKRLLAPPECAPRCAEIPRLAVDIRPDTLQWRLEIHAAAEAAVPLPDMPRAWRPETLTLDDTPVSAIARDEKGTTWIVVPAGVHQVTARGPLPPRNELTMVLPLVPRHATVRAQGWTVEGVDQYGNPAGQMKFTRTRTEQGKTLPELESGTLPAFVRVERTLRLGLTWSVETRVRRLSAPGTALLVEIPLLSGEAVTSETVQVRDGKALLNLPPQVMETSWEGALDIQPSLALQASASSSFHEVWRVDAGTVWHLEVEGIPVVHPTDSAGRWFPEWRPWPGETVTLHVTRPVGVPGPTLTLDQSTLTVHPGRRASDVSLALDLRSSQGGQHTLLLPEDAQLQAVTIAGVAQPVRQDGRKVVLPVTPGVQPVQVDWRSNEGVRVHWQSPEIDLGIPSVNHSIHVELPRDRWVLFTFGPALGPAVLFWGILIVVVLAAWGLSRLKYTPLGMVQWVLLGIGLTQSTLWGALLIVGWLLALGARGRLTATLPRWQFNALQVVLGVLTAITFSALVATVQQGLLGLPDMQVVGNQSTAYALNWYQDRADPVPPTAQVISVPLFVYRGLMLAWALWLAFAVLRWLRWGWTCFSHNGLWK